MKVSLLKPLQGRVSSNLPGLPDLAAVRATAVTKQLLKVFRKESGSFFSLAFIAQEDRFCSKRGEI